MPSTLPNLCTIIYELTGSPIKSGEFWADNIFPYIKTISHTDDYYFALFFGDLKGLTISPRKNRQKMLIFYTVLGKI